MCPISSEESGGGGMTPIFISAIIVRAKDPLALTKFYRDILGIPFCEADHEGDAPIHYECQLGDIHFAIYPGANELPEAQQNIKLALAVPSLQKVIRRLEQAGVKVLYDPVDRGFAEMTAVRDPEGNVVELTELTSWWLGHLEKRPRNTRDMVAAFKDTIK